MAEQTPERKATLAAEELAAEGRSVTARAVRERSGVRMAVAAEAARGWNAHAAEQAGVPVVPDSITTRFEGVWKEAYTAARAEFEQERAGWQATVERAEAESAELAKAVEAVEAERDQVRADATTALERAEAAHKETQSKAEAQAQQASEALAAERSRADQAEGALNAVTNERDRLLAELEQLRRHDND